MPLASPAGPDPRDSNRDTVSATTEEASTAEFGRAEVTVSLAENLGVPVGIVNDRYRVTGELGRGGMGAVVLADDLRLNRRVAIKFLRVDARPSDAARFEREARVL